MTKLTCPNPTLDGLEVTTVALTKKRRLGAARGDNEELLFWKRVQGKGLYELYRENTGGPYFLRLATNRRVKEYTIEPIHAESIVLGAKRERIRRIPNPILRNGYSTTFDGGLYDTRLDELVFVGVGNETDAAAIYRTKTGEYYVHHIENAVDEILKVGEDVGKMEVAIDFMFNSKPSFIEFLNWVSA
jgi:hypothetical protein